MIAYASNTGTRRTLSVLRRAGWRLMLTPDNPTSREGFRFAIDNGAFSSKGFREKQFTTLVERHGAAADFVVLPDIVAGGEQSLNLSVSWISSLVHLRMLLLPIQDGMTPESVGGILRSCRNLGLFLGGTTEFKISEMRLWGAVAAAMGRYYHVGRVNSQRRIRMCWNAGAHSFDGTSVTRFSVNLSLLDGARRQPPLFT